MTKSPINKSKLKKLINLTMDYDPNIGEERNSKHKPLDLLVLLILNQSCSDVLADRTFEIFKKNYKSYKQVLVENDEEILADVIKICGLAKTKSKYILNLLTFLQTHYDLDIDMPFLKGMSDKEALELLTSIKGIGTKSASCLLMFSLGRNTNPIDTHVTRIWKRVGIMSDSLALERAHRLTQPLFPDGTAFPVHVNLIELGRHICQARKTECKKCYLKSICNHCKKSQNLAK